jgi:hypothetical protein
MIIGLILWGAPLAGRGPLLDPPPDPEGFAAFVADHGVTPEMVATRSVAEDPTGAGPRLFFHHASGAKQGRNRIHLDVNSAADHRPSPEEVEAEKERLVALGATPVRLTTKGERAIRSRCEAPR